MKRISIVSVAIIMFSYSYAFAEPILFGWNYTANTSQGLVVVDQNTGEISSVIASDRKIEGLAFDSNSKVLYGIENTDVNTLIEIDIRNRSLNDIGIVPGFDEITSMTYDKFTDNIYALDQRTASLLTINPANADSSYVGFYFYSPTNSLAAHPLTGELYTVAGVGRSSLAKIDKTTGIATIVDSTNYNSRALSFNPETHELFGEIAFHSNPWNGLATIDIDTGIASPIGGSSPAITGLAYADLSFPVFYDSMVSTTQDYLTDYLTLGDTFTFDYWWEMGIEPTGSNFDVLFFNGTQWETFGWELNFNGSSTAWETASFYVPEWLRGQDVQIRFSLFDWGQETDPAVYLRNIESAPVPEPATIILLGTGLIGLAASASRRRFRK